MNDSGALQKRPIRYLAHSQNDDGRGVPELLSDHLQAVAKRARQFASPFDAEEQAHAAGLLHDLGKYADQFLRRLNNPREPSRDHWSTGAALLAAKYRRLGLVPAVAALGHHVGLDQLPSEAKDFCGSLSRAFKNRREDFTEANLALLLQHFQADGFAIPRVSSGLSVNERFAADMLDVRMLFSAAVLVSTNKDDSY